MTNTIISAAHLDYLQRSGVPLAGLSANGRGTQSDRQSRRLWHIHEIGRIHKKPIERQEKDVRAPSEDLITGLYGYKIPMAFLVRGSSNGVAFQWGTWVRDQGTSANGNLSHHRQEILKTSLNALYPAISLSPVQFTGLNLTKVGFALGIPTIVPFNPDDGSMALDRLIRAMANANWACLILAEPAEEQAVSQLRGSVVEEMRRIQSAAETKQAPPPLIKHYEELLSISLQNLTMAIATGSWRVGVYLMGDELSYYRLASLWRGLFTGEKSLPEPVRIWESPAVAELAGNWALPDEPAAAGPGFYRHPLAYQTLLTSRQLAAYCHLPQVETPGFAITAVPDFDTVAPQPSNKQRITLGQVMMHRRFVNQSYDIELAKLAKHTFVAGVTGAGKSNTIFHLLKEITKQNVPFLVIEPAKTEYRALLHEPALSGNLQVFTCGNEQVAPFRLNPFEVLPGTSISVHIDLLRSAFAASFGMWTPLPQILEQCLHEIYRDRGWDIVNNTNARLAENDDPYAASPTLTDLATKVDQVTRSLGYEERVTADLRAALLTRITSLRTGGKGRMLDVQRSVPVAHLLAQPTILELEGIGDDDDKAFLMGLILIRLAAFRRQQAQSNRLQHLIIIEEAHRLLANVSKESRQEEANPRGKAVETFANLLSEIRAYGQGVLVADQVPVKLAPDVIKNTNLKIVHRIVAADDRAALAGAMAMDERRATSLGILAEGQAVLFSEGDDAPLLVKIDPAKGERNSPTQAEVAKIMQKRQLHDVEAWSMRPGCTAQCQHSPELCTVAQQVVAEPAFQRTFARIILSIVHDVSGIDRLWPDLVTHVQARRPSGAIEANLWSCVISHAAYTVAHRRGSQAGWTYTQTENLAQIIEKAFRKKAKTGQAESECQELRKVFRSLYQRQFDPYPACNHICRQQPPLCLFRQAAADLITGGGLARNWAAAMAADQSEGEGWNRTWNACMDAGYEIIEFADETWPQAKIEENHTAARQVSLCFGQQMLVHNSQMAPKTAGRIISELITEAGHE